MKEQISELDANGWIEKVHLPMGSAHFVRAKEKR